MNMSCVIGTWDTAGSLPATQQYGVHGSEAGIPGSCTEGFPLSVSYFCSLLIKGSISTFPALLSPPPLPPDSLSLVLQPGCLSSEVLLLQPQYHSDLRKRQPPLAMHICEVLGFGTFHNNSHCIYLVSLRMRVAIEWRPWLSLEALEYREITHLNQPQIHKIAELKGTNKV